MYRWPLQHLFLFCMTVLAVMGGYVIITPDAAHRCAFAVVSVAFLFATGLGIGLRQPIAEVETIEQQRSMQLFVFGGILFSFIFAITLLLLIVQRSPRAQRLPAIQGTFPVARTLLESPRFSAPAARPLAIGTSAALVCRAIFLKAST